MRVKRNIDKRDQQAAIKYGTKEFLKGNKFKSNRYKYTFADVVYITTMDGIPVTSWTIPAPLVKCIIDDRLQNEIDLS